VASATVQVHGLVGVVVNAYDAFVGRDHTDRAAREVLVDAVSTIDLVNDARPPRTETRPRHSAGRGR